MLCNSNTSIVLQFVVYRVYYSRIEPHALLVSISDQPRVARDGSNIRC